MAKQGVQYDIGVGDQSLLRAMRALEKEQKQVEQNFKKIGSAARRSNSEAKKMRSIKSGGLALAKSVGLGVGLTELVGQFSRIADVMERNLAETADRARQFYSAAIPFQQIQPQGMKQSRTLDVLSLAAQTGTRNPSEALNIVQALQSVVGDYGAAYAASGDALRAPRLGVTTGDALNIMRSGVSRKVDPRESLRMMLAAGNLSGGSAQELAPAASAFSVFAGEEAFAHAVAAITLDSFGAENRTAVKNVGKALQGTSKLSGVFRELGVDDASMAERAQALAASGRFRGVEELQRGGLTDFDQAFAMNFLLQNFDRVPGNMATINAARYDEGYARTARARIESESPAQRIIRETDTAYARGLESQIGGAGSALGVQQGRVTVGTVARGLGVEQVGPFDAIDSEGQITAAGLAALPFHKQISAAGSGFEVMIELLGRLVQIGERQAAPAGGALVEPGADQ